MRLLLDTCALLWWWAEPEKLSPRALSLIRQPDSEIWVSAASAWEIATKHRIGKFPYGGRIIPEWGDRLKKDNFKELAISHRHALKAGAIIGEHRDPFDRMIGAQSILETLPVLSPDTALSGLGADRCW